MRRRKLLAALAAAPWLASGQPARRRLRVACLVDGSEAVIASLLRRVDSGLASAGLTGVELRSFVPDAEDAAATGRAAAAAVAWQPDAILSPGPPWTLAARDATRTIPVGCFAVPDPETLGLVQTVARPGGNLTGSAFDATALAMKRVEVVREILPRATRVTAFYRKRPNTPWTLIDRIRTEMAAAAARLGLGYDEAEVGAAGFAATLAAVEKRRPDAIVPFGPHDWEPDGRPVDAVASFREFERRSRILVIGEGAYAVRQGLTVAMYDGGSQLRAGVDQLARVLKGAAPAELPITFPREYFVAVNRGAARALGIVLPPSIMIRAEPVVD